MPQPQTEVLTNQVMFKPSMAMFIKNLHQGTDRRADARSILLAAVLIFLSLITQSLAQITETVRAGSLLSPQHVWTLEATSHLAILTLVPLLLLVINRAPLGATSWRWALPIHVLACMVFSLLHVVLMWGTRQALFPVLVGYPYTFDLLSPASFGYEFTKDGFTYVLLICGLIASRVIERRRIDAGKAQAADMAAGRLTLSSGGTTVVLAASEISYAKAAENYVEVHAGAKPHLVRITLAKLESMLQEHSRSHARVHRSYLINLDQVVEITPTGEGDVSIRLRNGAVIRGSRRYRDKLAQFENQ